MALLSIASLVTLLDSRSFVCNVRILALPASVSGEVTRLLACHTLVLSKPSNYLIQCSAFACCIFSVHQLHYWQCSLWMGWSRLAQWYFTLPASLCICFFSSASSDDHHHFEYGLSFNSSMCLLMASYIALFSVLSVSLKVWIFVISVGGGRLVRFRFRFCPVGKSKISSWCDCDSQGVNV